MVKFFYCSLILFASALILLCCTGALKSKPGEAIKADSVKDSISYKIFSTENKGYGFDIIVNGKIYIHQPFIPTWEGFQRFPSKETATTVASLISQKLIKKKFRFLLEMPELDSIMRKYFIFNAVINNIKESEIRTFLQNAASLKTTESQLTFIDKLPRLNDFPVKNKWVSKGIVPFGARSGMISFTIKNCIYLGSGELKDLKTKDLWCYNADLNFWTCMAEFPGYKRLGGVGFSIYDKGYWGLGTGYKKNTGMFVKDLYEYDPRANSWSRKENFPGSERTDATDFVINNKAYIGLGYAKDYCADMYEYDPTRKKKWKRIADFGGGPVSSSTGVGLFNKGFIIAGDRLSNNKKFTFEYLPLEDKWIQQKDLPGGARFFLCSCKIDTNMFIAGGGGAEGGEIKFRDFYVFDASHNAWSSAEDYPISKNGISKSVGGNVNGKAFLGTGFNGNYLNDWNAFEYYFSIRKDTGIYNETVCYPLKYNGKWQLYQECLNNDCFAGAQIKSDEDLGSFCYKSRVTNDYEELYLKDNSNKTTAKFILLPRYFAISTDKAPAKEVGLRLFFTNKELANLAARFVKVTREKFSLDKIKILQYNNSSNLQPKNNSMDLSHYKIISPRLFSYGFEGETMVADFTTPILHSEFYLAIISN